MENPTLNDAEARILGVLIEKAFTTPDQYPLSLNAIRNGCNQKSNREPVTNFVEAEIVAGLQGLVPKHFAGKVNEAGSRVEKFRHTAREALHVDDGEIAILAELLVRGPQAQGELRGRVHRMVPTPTLPDLRARLETLIAKGLVERVAPVHGSRATRYAQLLSPGLHATEPAPATAPPEAPAVVVPSTPAAPAPSPSTASAPRGLEARVETLEQELKDLRETVAGLLSELS